MCCSPGSLETPCVVFVESVCALMASNGRSRVSPLSAAASFAGAADGTKGAALKQPMNSRSSPTGTFFLKRLRQTWQGLDFKSRYAN